MSLDEFTARMAAADERFEHALKRGDIPEMRAALAEKTDLMKTYFARPKARVRKEKRKTKIARPA